MSDFDYRKEQEEQKPKKPLYLIFPKYTEQLRSLKLSVVPNLEDDNLTRFMELAEPESIEKVVSAMVRRREVDWLGDKSRKEFLVWAENWFGTDKNGNIVPSVYYIHGMDKLARMRKEIDSEGKTVYKEAALPLTVYTQEFSANKVDEIINSSVRNTGETIQFSCEGLRSWGGFTLEEFRDLSFEELNERGITRIAGSPIVKAKTKKGKKV